MMNTDTKPRRAKTKTEKLFAGLDKPSLHALSYALRHPDTWPKGFVWNYGNCRNCAMGLAHSLWSCLGPAPKSGNGWKGSRAVVCKMAQDFAMPLEDARRIFYETKIIKTKLTRKTFLGLGPDREKVESEEVLYEDVMPEMVADQIDKYLATAE